MSNGNSLLIVFLHLERSGGSTINGWFSATEEHFKKGVNYFEHRDGESINLSVDSLVYPKVCYFSGHFSLSDALNLVGPWKFEKILLITVLRKPVDRVISGYRLWLRSPDWFPDLQSIPKTFPDYYAATRDFYSMNFACRRIAGCQNASEAADILKKKFSMVGFTDDFASFERRLGERLNELVPNLHLLSGPEKTNQGLDFDEREIERHDLTKDVLEEIISDNIEDQKLYQIMSDSWYGSDYYRMRFQFA